MKRFVIFTFICACLTGPLMAQQEILPSKNQRYVTTGISFQLWKHHEYDHPVQQVTFPVQLMIPMNDHLNVTLTHMAAFSWWDELHKISGLSDTWVNGTYVFLEDQAMLNVGIGAPTGKTRLSQYEYELAWQWLTPNVFRYRLPVYGQGLCAKVGGALAIPIAQDFILGLGAQFVSRSPYVPVEYKYEYMDGSTPVTKVMAKTFNPGDEYSLHAGLDVRPHENVKFSIDVILTQYERDELSGREVFGSGSKTAVDMGFFYRFNDDLNYIWANMVFRQKGKNEFLQGAYIENEQLNKNGAQIDLDLRVKAFNFEDAVLFFLGEGRFYNKNEAGIGGAGLFGLGAGGQVSIYDNMLLDFTAKFLTGQIHDETSKRIDGLDAILTLVYSW